MAALRLSLVMSRAPYRNLIDIILLLLSIIIKPQEP